MSIAAERAALSAQMIGPMMPRLWCPPLAHYTGGSDARPYGRLDLERMAAHWSAMCPHVGGFLVPGSTGDGWEMDEAELMEVVDFAMDLATKLGARILVGVLRTEIEAMRRVIADTVARLKAQTGESDALAAMRARHVVGFTITAPKGRELTQAQIQAALESVLAMELPIALYQLPQVTENEVAPEVFEALAARYPNLLLFKDSSGEDRVAMADCGKSGVFLVRGAEGAYAQSLVEDGGCYQGLLLSSANNFAAVLGGVLSLLEVGRTVEARALSDRVGEVIAAAFAMLQGCPHGNVFANANKAINHWMAYGSKALNVPPPMLHAGVRLPISAIKAVGQILRDAGFMPDQGYVA